MKAISIQQPWATLIASGLKRMETRTWQTAYRGLILIHASKLTPFAQQLCYEAPFSKALSRLNIASPALLPISKLIAIATLTDCLPIEKVTGMDSIMEAMSPDELHFGDFSPGNFAWFFNNIEQLRPPISCPGRLGLWDPQSVLNPLEQLLQVQIQQYETRFGAT